MSTQLQQLFEGLDNASVESRRPKLADGKYRVEIQRNELADGYETGGVSFIIEFQIVECFTPAVADKFPAGRELSATINRLDSNKQADRNLALGNLKAFLSAALSYKFQSYVSPDDPAQKWQQIAMLCASEHTTLSGCHVMVQVDTIKTKAGHDFSKHSWTPVPEFSQP